MNYADQIYTQAQVLPEDLQLQLLDFVRFLTWKMQEETQEKYNFETENINLANHYTEAILESEQDIEQGNVISHKDLKTEIQQWRNQ
jgi:hypothetical protein